jgi:hypothetical protein
MYKYLLIFVLLASTAQSLDNSIYEDSILWVYNSSCIETCNYLYLFINIGELDLNLFDSYDNRNIAVKEIKTLGPKSVLANIYLEPLPPEKLICCFD